MRSEQYAPQLSDRNNRPQWEKGGGFSAGERAASVCRSILEQPPASVLPEETRLRIRKEIPGLLPFLME
jgi:trimethylamine:corrinoid methyltransferase-like protein